jgi:hypothetical protein
MKDPVSGGLVLPRTRFEQVAHDGDPSCAAHALSRLARPRETEYSMASGHEELDQL